MSLTQRQGNSRRLWASLVAQLVKNPPAMRWKLLKTTKEFELASEARVRF